MRCNPKFFELGNSSQPFETQEFDGRTIDLYYMNDFDTAFDQNIAQGRFAMWSSQDGYNYRLYIEHGFHDELKSLYTAQVNKLWLDYWDKVDNFTKKVNFKILLPICILLIGLLILLTLLVKNTKVVTILQIVLAAAFIIGMFMTSSFQKRKAATFHQEAMEAIKKEVGQNNFDRLIERQNSYIDEYLEAKAKAEEEKYRLEHPEDFADEVTDETAPVTSNEEVTDTTSDTLVEAISEETSDEAIESSDELNGDVEETSEEIVEKDLDEEKSKQ